MKNLRRSFIFILVLTMLMSFCSPVSFAEERDGVFKGFIVNSMDNMDFPSKSNLSIFALVREIKEILTFAGENNVNSILLEVRPDETALYKSKIYPTSDFWLKEEGDFTFYDLTKDFVRRASKEEIDVYALVDMGLADAGGNDFSKKLEDNIADIKHLSQKYGFKGILLKNFPKLEGEEYEKFFANVKENAEVENLGVFYEPLLYSEADNAFIAHGVDFIIPSLDSSLSFRNSEGYIPELNNLRKLNDKVVPFTDLSKVSDVTPTLSTMHFEALNAGFESFFLGSYSALRDNANMQMSLISTVENMADMVLSLDTGYEPVKKFDITRPVKNISTPYSTYFIMGTSDPDYPVYYRGEKLERNSEDGLWGVKVNLSMGNNYFTFAQNGISKSVNIRRYSYGEGSPALINKITKAFPWDNAIFKAGEENTVSCIAPAGGKVYAVVDGKTVPMEQAAQAQRGVPALYKGTVTLFGKGSQEVSSLGNIEYFLTFNGVNTSYTAKGELYLQDEDARARVRTNIIFANVLTPELEFGDFKSIYKEGTTEEVVDMTYANNDWYYELASGGFIKAADVEVLESSSNEPPAALSECEFVKEDNEERIIIKDVPGLPYFFDEKDDGSTVLSLFGDFKSEDIEYFKTFLETTESEYYSSIKLETSEKEIDITFVPYDKEKIWGFDVIYEDGDTVIMSKVKPIPSDDVRKPLKNVTVAIDPGHGGMDSGALGVLGTDGPMEKHVNLLNAQVLRERLEGLGAKVVLTRETNEENPTLLERANTAYINDADIFMSLHHNSIAEAADGNKYSGVEAYYYEDFGKKLAELIPSKISQNNADRDYRKTEWGYYVVTKIRCAPALLAEIGFMPSPFEYERVCDADEIFKTSEAITAAILELVQ